MLQRDRTCCCSRLGRAAGSQQAVAMLCHTAADKPKHLFEEHSTLCSLCPFSWELLQWFMSHSCSPSSQHRHQAPSLRCVSVPAQMEHNINGIRLPRSELHQAAGNTCFDSHRCRVSAVLPRACWSSSPALPHPLEVHTPSNGPLLAPGTDADLMASLTMRFAFALAGQLQPGVYLVQLQLCKAQTLCLTHLMAHLFSEPELLGG